MSELAKLSAHTRISALVNRSPLDGEDARNQGAMAYVDDEDAGLAAATRSSLGRTTDTRLFPSVTQKPKSAFDPSILSATTTGGGAVALKGDFVSDGIGNLVDRASGLVSKAVSGGANLWADLDDSTKKKLLIAAGSVAAAPIAWQGVKGLARGMGINAPQWLSNLAGSDSDNDVDRAAVLEGVRGLQAGEENAENAIHIPAASLERLIRLGQAYDERVKFGPVSGITLANDPLALVCCDTPNYHVDSEGNLLFGPDLNTFIAGGLWDSIKKVGKKVVSGVAKLADSGLGRLVTSVIPGGGIIAAGAKLANSLLQPSAAAATKASNAESPHTDSHTQTLVDLSHADAVVSSPVAQGIAAKATANGAIAAPPAPLDVEAFITAKRPSVTSKDEASERLKTLATRAAVASVQLGGDPVRGALGSSITQAATKAALELAKTGADLKAYRLDNDLSDGSVISRNATGVQLVDAIPDSARDNLFVDMIVEGSNRALAGSPGIVSGAKTAIMMLPKITKYLAKLGSSKIAKTIASPNTQRIVVSRGVPVKSLVGGAAIAYLIGRSDSSTGSDVKALIDSDTIALVAAALTPSQANELVQLLAVVKTGGALTARESKKLRELIVASIVSARARLEQEVASDADIELLEEAAKIADAADVPSTDIARMAEEMSSHLVDGDVLSGVTLPATFGTVLSTAGGDLTDDQVAALMMNPTLSQAVAEGDSSKITSILKQVGLATAASVAATGVILGGKKLLDTAKRITTDGIGGTRVIRSDQGTIDNRTLSANN